MLSLVGTQVTLSPTDAAAETPPKALAAQLAVILGELANLVATGLRSHPLRKVLLPFIVLYIKGVARRLTLLSARIAAGLPARKQAPRVLTEEQREHERTRPRARFPREYGWLPRDLRACSFAGCQYPDFLRASGLRYRNAMVAVLLQHDAAALAEAHPEIARTLRPLCRMLGIELFGVKPPPPPPYTPPKPPPPPSPDPPWWQGRAPNRVRLPWHDPDAPIPAPAFKSLFWR
jgi:hypothetical protein